MGLMEKEAQLRAAKEFLKSMDFYKDEAEKILEKRGDCIRINPKIFYSFVKERLNEDFGFRNILYRVDRNMLQHFSAMGLRFLIGEFFEFFEKNNNISKSNLFYSSIPNFDINYRNISNLLIGVIVDGTIEKIRRKSTRVVGEKRFEMLLEQSDKVEVLPEIYTGGLVKKKIGLYIMDLKEKGGLAVMSSIEDIYLYGLIKYYCDYLTENIIASKIYDFTRTNILKEISKQVSLSSTYSGDLRLKKLLFYNYVKNLYKIYNNMELKEEEKSFIIKEMNLYFSMCQDIVRREKEIREGESGLSLDYCYGIEEAKKIGGFLNEMERKG